MPAHGPPTCGETHLMTENAASSHELAGAAEPHTVSIPDTAREIQVLSWDTNTNRSDKDFRPLPVETSGPPPKTAEQLVEEELVVPKDSSAAEPADSSDAADQMEKLSLEASGETASPPVVKVNTPGKVPVVG